MGKPWFSWCRAPLAFDRSPRINAPEATVENRRACARKNKRRARRRACENRPVSRWRPKISGAGRDADERTVTLDARCQPGNPAGGDDGRPAGHDGSGGRAWVLEVLGQILDAAGQQRDSHLGTGVASWVAYSAMIWSLTPCSAAQASPLYSLRGASGRLPDADSPRLTVARPSCQSPRERRS